MSRYFEDVRYVGCDCDTRIFSHVQYMVQCYTEYELSATVFGAVIVSFLNTIWSMEVLASAFVGPVTTISTSLSSARTSFVLSWANATVRENPSPLHFDKFSDRMTADGGCSYRLLPGDACPM
jgi:hypothetical protein